MKYLLLLVVLMVAIMIWRSGRDGAPTRKASGKAPVQPQPHDMVSCPVCSVHVPKPDAFAGERGYYCSTQHRQQAEG